MKHSYFYAAVQCRDARAYREMRTVGAVLVAPEVSFGDLRYIPLARKLGADDATFVQAVLDDWKVEVEELARGGRSAALGWLREHALDSDDAVRVTEPVAGVTDDVERELKRLLHEVTGYRPVKITTPAERTVHAVLKRHHIHKAFQQRAFTTQFAEWRFPLVCGSHLLHPVTLDQKRPEGVLDAVFRDVGRFDEIRRAYDLDVLAVVAPPQNPAAGRAQDVYRDHAVEVVSTVEVDVESALRRRGLIEGSGRVWSAGGGAHSARANERRHGRG